MADIDLVPKHRTTTWIWWVIAAIVVVALLVWFMGGTHRTARLDRGPAPVAVNASGASAPLAIRPA